MTPSVVHLPKF